MPSPLAPEQADEVGKQLWRMLGRDVCNTLGGGETVKNRTDTFLTASQKRKDKKLIFTHVVYEIQLQPKAVCFIKNNN